MTNNWGDLLGTAVGLGLTAKVVSDTSDYMFKKKRSSKSKKQVYGSWW
jgi:hypothetical protein